MAVPRNTFLLFLLAVLSACSAAPQLPPLAEVSPQERERLLHLEGQFDLPATSLTEPDDNIFGLDADMRYFVNEHVPAVLSPRARLRYLSDALASPAKLGLSYNPGLTLTASQAYYQGEGNCLSLTALFVALAREAKLNAYFNEVTIPPSWEMLSNNSSATYRHVNAVVDLGEGRTEVVDFSVDIYDYRYPQNRISENTLSAQFYSNRGIQFLNQQNYGQAYLYLRRAVYLAPEQAYLWGNLGVLFRRQGLDPQAELAYRYALQLNPDENASLNNLARLYRDQQQDKAAKALEQVAEARQRDNPFLYYSHARDAYERGEFNLALAAIHRAIRLNNDEYRFHQFAAVIYRRLGNMEKYEEFGRRAARLKLAKST